MHGPFFELVYFHEESEHTKEWLKKADESLKWIKFSRENECIWLQLSWYATPFFLEKDILLVEKWHYLKIKMLSYCCAESTVTAFS